MGEIVSYSPRKPPPYDSSFMWILLKDLVGILAWKSDVDELLLKGRSFPIVWYTSGHPSWYYCEHSNEGGVDGCANADASVQMNCLIVELRQF